LFVSKSGKRNNLSRDAFDLLKFSEAVEQFKFEMDKIRDFFNLINEKLKEGFKSVSQISGDQILDLLSHPITIAILMAISVGSIIFLICNWNEIALVFELRRQLGGVEFKRMKDDMSRGPNPGDPDDDSNAPTDFPIPIVSHETVENKVPVIKGN